MQAVSLNSDWWMLHPFLAQAVCICQPGLMSLNNDASTGCYAFCKPHSCDKSATCQVTADKKTTRWAQGSSGNGHGAGRVEWVVYSAVFLHSRPGKEGWGGPGGWPVMSLTSLSGSPDVCARMVRWVTVVPATDTCSMRFRGPIR